MEGEEENPNKVRRLNDFVIEKINATKRCNKN